jgi:laccase
VDVLLAADQEVGSYFMAANSYVSARPAAPFDNTTTRGIVVYEGAPTSATPIMPRMPAFNDTPTAHKFFTSITGLAGGPHWVPVPRQIDEHMFVTVGLGLSICPTCLNGTRLSASMNNLSFARPSSLSMLQAFFFNVSGIYTPDFPDTPPVKFDYTNVINAVNPSLLITPKSTSVKVLKYNATVEMVLQNTALLGVENHPIHLHGFNFHVLAQGFGNYDPVNDPKKFNLINPLSRNTINVPVGGWGVIRFTANNPGVWFFHCHLDVHLPFGLATAFVVENGPTPESTLPPPPVDLPQC